MFDIIIGNIFWLFAKIGFFNSMDDCDYLKKVFFYKMHKKLDLDEPRTLNEKIQWLKIYDRNPIYTDLVDKSKVKNFVSNLIGEEYVIPTLGIWDNANDINWNNLPSKFVLKVTHDSGGIVICKDKSLLDKKNTIKILNKALKNNYYKLYREWPYKNVERKIICEPYLEDSKTKELRDYKFFCFNGIPEIMFVASDRQTKNEEVKFDFFDMNYNWLNIVNGHPNASIHPEKPLNFDKMIYFSKLLSKNIPFVRIDFYEVDGSLYFGEMTFYHFSGLVPFEPYSWDELLGDKLFLEMLKNE